MKPTRVFDILVGLTFVGLLGSYINSHYIVPTKKRDLPPVIITKANDLLKYKTKIPAASLNTTATSSACTLFLKNSAELSMNDYANEFIDHHVDEILKTCAGAFPQTLEDKINEAILKCQDSTRDLIKPQCYLALMGAKTKSVVTAIRPDVNPKDLDATLLLQLIADKFATNDLYEHPEKSLEMINALLDKSPNYLSGYKLKLLLLATSSLNTDEKYNVLFNDTLLDAKRLKNKDIELTELELVKKGNFFNPKNGNTNNPDFLEYLDTEGRAHPKEWIYDYYKANALYENGKGDYNKTLALVEKALRKSPNNPRLKQALDNLKSDDEIRRSHPFVISVGFSLDDL